MDANGEWNWQLVAQGSAQSFLATAKYQMNDYTDGWEATTDTREILSFLPVLLSRKCLKIRTGQKHRHSISNSSLLWNQMETWEGFKVKFDSVIKHGWMQQRGRTRALGAVLICSFVSGCRAVCWRVLFAVWCVYGFLSWTGFKLGSCHIILRGEAHASFGLSFSCLDVEFIL